MWAEEGAGEGNAKEEGEGSGMSNFNEPGDFPVLWGKI